MTKMLISPEDCMANNTCWPKERLEDYTKKYGKNGKVRVQTILDDENVSIVDKMYIVDITKLLTPQDAHWLSVEFASHWMEPANKDGLKAVKMKVYWLKDRCDDQDLEDAEKLAWEEAKVYPKSKSAAFAAKKDPYLAMRGSAALAGGWYGETIVPEEKEWQWSLILDRLEGYDG